VLVEDIDIQGEGCFVYRNIVINLMKIIKKFQCKICDTYFDIIMQLPRGLVTKQVMASSRSKRVCEEKPKLLSVQ
jgi:hypothetical protein